MAITWGRMKTQRQKEQAIMRENAVLEQSCLEQAKREIDPGPYTTIAYIRAVLCRAQQIKQERKKCQ